MNPSNKPVTLKSTIPCDLPINGILLINKPKNLSSNNVLQKVKRLYQAKKAGHTGTLDPLATGMLPICFGEATKLSQYILNSNKTYEVTGLLGIKTSTGDAMGEILATSSNFNISKDKLLSIINQFVGSIKQIPPMVSALKFKGKPLYKWAREGVEISRKPRDILIHSIDLQHFSEHEFSLTVTCSKGTYIRSLIEDIGQELGVYAHVTALHRKSTAGFDKHPMYCLDELSNQDNIYRLNCLLPLEFAVAHLPKLNIDKDMTIKLKNGQTVPCPSYDKDGIFRLHDASLGFIGLGNLVCNNLKVQRLINF